MTEQEIFDEALTKIVAQGKASVSDGSCVYESPDGTHCGVGCLLTSEEIVAVKASGYNEGFGAVDLIKEMQLERFYGHVSLLDSIQSAHDGAAAGVDDFVEYFVQYMKDVAKDFELTFNDPTVVKDA